MVSLRKAGWQEPSAQHVEPAVVSSIMTADGWLALMSVAKYRLFSAAKYRLFSADDVCARS